MEPNVEWQKYSIYVLPKCQILTVFLFCDACIILYLRIIYIYVHVIIHNLHCTLPTLDRNPVDVLRFCAKQMRMPLTVSRGQYKH